MIYFYTKAYFTKAEKETSAGKANSPSQLKRSHSAGTQGLGASLAQGTTAPWKKHSTHPVCPAAMENVALLGAPSSVGLHSPWGLCQGLPGDPGQP